MGENQVDYFLGETVKRFALGYNIPKQGMVFLNLGLLAGLVRVTKEQIRFRFSVQIMHKSKNIGKLAAVEWLH